MKLRIIFSVVILSTVTVFCLGLASTKLTVVQAQASGPCDLEVVSTDSWEIPIYDPVPTILDSTYGGHHPVGAGAQSFTLFPGLDTNGYYPTFSLRNTFHCAKTATSGPLYFSVGGGIQLLSTNHNNAVYVMPTGDINFNLVASRDFGLWWTAAQTWSQVLPCVPSGPFDPSVWVTEPYRTDANIFCTSLSSFLTNNPDYLTYEASAAVNYPYFNLADANLMTKEDAVIDYINTAHKMTVTGAGETFDIPASNCKHISGDGPRKVVFMRGKSWSTTAGDFMTQVNNVINSGFASIDPYKSYIDQFSFYADLKKFDDTGAPVYPPPITNGGYQFFTLGFGDVIKAASSCNGVDGINNNADQYLFYFNNPTLYAAWAPFHKIAFFNMSSVFTPGLAGDARTAMHEVSHTFAHLLDEYSDSIYAPSGGWAQLIFDEPMAINCTWQPGNYFRSSIDNKMYGSNATDAIGCTGGYILPHSPKDAEIKYVYRPSSASLMKNQFLQSKMNVIDCGYVLSAIHGESASSRAQGKKNAEKYWNECLGMATSTRSIVIDSLPPITPTPHITNVSPPSVSPGFPGALTDPEFTPTDNAVKFTNATSGVSYDIPGLPSDGTHLSFIVPVDASPGNYNLQSGAFNSDWSSPVPFTILPPILPVISLTASPANPKLGSTTLISWVTAGASTCVGLGNFGTTSPAEWMHPELSDSFQFNFTQNATLTLQCTGPGGAVINRVQIIVDTSNPLPNAPTVNLIATPQTLTLGQGTTISWNTSGASICRGSGTGDSGTLLSWNQTQPLTGFLYLSPIQNAVLSLFCMGSSQGATSTISISVNPIPVTPLFVSCSVFPQTTVHLNQLATFTASTTGGNGAYTYSWAGSEGLTGNTQSRSVFFQTAGSKTVSVNVISGAQSVTATCPSVIYNPAILGPSTGQSLYAPILSPSSGQAGVIITANGTAGVPWNISNYADGATSVVIRNSGHTMYIKPISVDDFDGTLSFAFNPSTPPLGSSTPGSVYSVSVVNNMIIGGIQATLVESPVASFTLTTSTPQIPPVIPPPSVTSIFPSSGIPNAQIILTGTGFNSSTVVVARKDSSTYVISPSSFTSTTTTFFFNPSPVIFGDWNILASNNGAISTTTIFTLMTPPVLPTISITSNPANVSAGQSITVSWVTSNAFSCQGSSNSTSTPSLWLSPPFVGSFTFTPYQNTTWTLACTGARGVATSSGSVTIGASSSQPIVFLSANPTSIPFGQSSLITYSASGATSCEGFINGVPAPSVWPFTPLSGSFWPTLNTPSYTHIFSYGCTGPGGSATSTASVTVGPITSGGGAGGGITTHMVGRPKVSDPSAPSATNEMRVGDTVTISWTSVGIDSSAPVDIDLYNYKGSKQVMNIVGAVPNTGSYSWTVPDIITIGEDTVFTIRVKPQSPYLSGTSGKIEVYPANTPTVPSITAWFTDDTNSSTVNTLSTVPHMYHFNWNSTNANVCNIINTPGLLVVNDMNYGFWRIDGQTSGNFQVYSMSAGSGQVVIKCTNTGGGVAQVSAYYAIQSVPPTVSLSATPSSVTHGTSVNVVWSSTDAVSCQGTWTAGTSAPSWWATPSTSGSQNYTTSEADTGTIQLGLTCTGPGGSATQNITVTNSEPEQQSLVPLASWLANVFNSLSGLMMRSIK